MAYLILARHGESEFNAKALWTGIWDVPLTDKGRQDAALMAHVVTDLPPQVAFTSALTRARDTLDIILHTNNWRPAVHTSAALNERDYGELTGMNKWDVEKRYGETQFQAWRRGWDTPVPGGETLKAVYERAIPYLKGHILPELADNKTVLVVAHGNTLRAVMKYLDKLSDEAVQSLEMPFGQIIIYQWQPDGILSHKEVRRIS